MNSLLTSLALAIAASSAVAQTTTPFPIEESTFHSQSTAITGPTSVEDAGIAVLQSDLSGTITYPIAIENTMGFDIGRVVFRIEPHSSETYAPGEFEQIVFASPSIADVTDSPIPGDTDAPFSVSSVGMSDDNGNLAANQRLDFVFDGSSPHAEGDGLLYEITIDNPTDKLYTYSVEFFQVPAPGASALALLASGLVLTRRRNG